MLQDVTIPDDGKPRGSGLGPAQRVRLSTKVERKGVYALNVTMSQDRYGEEMLWGFQTNCPRYLIETSRGHKDERHQEPIVLAGSERPGDVCFLPREGPLAMEITGLPAGCESLHGLRRRRQALGHACRSPTAGRRTRSRPTFRATPCPGGCTCRSRRRPSTSTA